MAHDTIEAPGPLVLPPAFHKATKALIGVGVIGAVLGAVIDIRMFQSGWIAGFWLTLSFALLAGFFVGIGYTSHAFWNVSVRRIAEAMMAWIPYAAGLGLVVVGFLFLGDQSVFDHWLHPHGTHAELIMKKAWWLNTTRFIITYAVIIGLFIVVAGKLVSNSRAQDVDGDPEFTWRNRALGPAYLGIFALGYSALAVDFVMSLQPTWFSTMWGVYMFAGAWQATLALICLVAVLLIERNAVSRALVNENHVHDLGKFTFAFTIFYAYIAFCQFLLIWYAELPEETTFYDVRMHNGWGTLSWILIFAKFVIPFLWFLRHSIKRMGRTLKAACLFVIAAQIFELWWLIGPAVRDGTAHPGPGIPFVELMIVCGFLGGFLLVAGKALASHNLVPIKDPQLYDCVNHHQL
jgi:hypothetical protein